MKLSKKCRYALRALIDLSVNSGADRIVLSDIARRNQISQQYLEQVFASLRKAGIVMGIKGSQGGYKLNRRPDQITVSQILEAVDGSYLVEREEPLEDGNGRSIAAAIQTLVIDPLNSSLVQVLEQVTLADLVKQYLDSRDYDLNMYYI